MNMMMMNMSPVPKVGPNMFMLLHVSAFAFSAPSLTLPHTRWEGRRSGGAPRAVSKRFFNPQPGPRPN